MRIGRDLLLVPISAVLVYLLVVNLPFRQDSDRKIASSENDAVALRAQVLGSGHVWDAFVPWRRLFAGESVGLAGQPFTATDLGRAAGLSLLLGLLALGLALAWSLLLAVARVSLAGRKVGVVLELIPGLVFGSPLFLLAVVAALLAIALGVPFTGSHLLAASVMALGPGTFLGVVFSDALRVEAARPYFVAALARGCSRRRALLRHALPNALPALLDAAAPVASSLLLGSFVAENFFQLKGFGLVYLEAARRVDAGVVVVATTLFASVLIVVSVLVELVRIFVDPKARDAAKEGRA
jgi:oligopeptide transport system permease protein